jgi:hypothetical protein
MNAFGHKCNPMSHQHRFNLGQNEVKLPKKQLKVIENVINPVATNIINLVANFQSPQSMTKKFQSPTFGCHNQQLNFSNLPQKIWADRKLLGTT